MKKVKVVFLFILIFSGFLLVACQANYIRDVQGEPAEFGKNRTLRFSGHP
ncbi:colicin release lysis protein [Klebsiella pneumoniae]